MTQQTQTETYDLNAIASAVNIKPERARLIIGELVEQFNFDATTVPQNTLVSILGSVIGLMQTHNLSITQAVQKYVSTLRDQQKKTESKTANTAENMAGQFDKLSSDWAKQLAPVLVKQTVDKTFSEARDLLAQAFLSNPFDDCFAEVELILDVKFQEVEKQKTFQSNGQENLLTYFALPQGK